MFDVIKGVLEGMAVKLQALTSTVWGAAVLSLSSIMALLAPSKDIFALLLLFVVVDFVFGVWSSLKLKKKITSEKLRGTGYKIMIYSIVLILVIFIERTIKKDWDIGEKIVFAGAAACELWSIAAHMLIIKPDMAFLRIFKMSLSGEIADKLKVDRADIEKALSDENENKEKINENDEHSEEAEGEASVRAKRRNE